MLLNLHARIDIVDAKLDNPMHIAVSMGYRDILKQLLRANKDRMELGCFSRDTSRPDENIDIRQMTNAENNKPIDIAFGETRHGTINIMKADLKKNMKYQNIHIIVCILCSIGIGRYIQSEKKYNESSKQ
uniref:ANK_REP_REGION domain-containing protein n=1 Tax=Trichobilharzia regenti TaxID=157069 RepID=A0AA85J4W9_TRIRE|nr:unnamed protein product [Trichobilharzia regenti]